jgi:predicted HTH transcriptional regulator
MMNKNGKVVLYPDHSIYHKSKSLGNSSRTKPLTESAFASRTNDISPYAKVSESETLEYKSSFAERDKIIETIVAFRNIRKAGTIIVGVDNEGNIKGEKRTKQQCIDVETDFLNTVRQVKCNVKLENYIEFDWCDEGRTCHISVKRAFDNKITYFKDELVVRNGASNISLKSEEMENFIINFYSLNL